MLPGYTESLACTQILVVLIFNCLLMLFISVSFVKLHPLTLSL